jgi:hypothetical protein
MTKALVLKQFGLTKGNVNYSEKANAFLSDGYTSAAGNTYFNAVRFAEGIVIKEDVGIGYAYKFLNGLQIFSLKDKTLLADRDYYNRIYSKQTIKQQAVIMLLEVLREAAVKENMKLNEPQATKEIERIIDQAMNGNQLEILNKQSQKYLK